MDKSSKKKKLAKLKFNQYRGNQAEGQGFTDEKKRKAILQYQKLLRKEGRAQGVGAGQNTDREQGARSIVQGGQAGQRRGKVQERGTKPSAGAGHPRLQGAGPAKHRAGAGQGAATGTPKSMQKRPTQKPHPDGGNQTQQHHRHPAKQSDSPGKQSRYWKEKLQFEKETEHKQQKRLEFEQKQKERQEALDKYSQQKKNKYKVLAKRTFRGQPKLSSQMELLVAKLEAEKKS